MRTFPGTLDLLPLLLTGYVVPRGFQSDPADSVISFLFLPHRPLPEEEEELDDELFAGTSEEGDAGDLLRTLVFYYSKE